jgi:sulfoxide reductase heme-binding subunit YedZ
MTQGATRTLRHVALAAGSALSTYGVFAAVPGDDTRFRLSMATAYVGLALLAVTLVIGPWNVLRGAPNPVSTNVRRDVAIWAGIVSLTHLVIGLLVHLRGSMWKYFVFPADAGRAVPVRYDPFGIANWTGLVAGS